MNIIKIIRNFKNSGKSIEVYSPLFGTIDSDKLRIYDKEIEVSTINNCLHFNEYGQYIMNFDEVGGYSKVPSKECMLNPVDKTWEELNPSILNKFIKIDSNIPHYRSRVYYTYTHGDDIELVDSIGDRFKYYPGTEYTELSKDEVSMFVREVLNNTDACKVLSRVLDNYSIISCYPRFHVNSFVLMMDLIPDGDSIENSNVINYVLRIPIEMLNNYEFNWNDLKKFDEDPIK